MLETILISKRVIFNKLVILHEYGEFSEIKGTICNAPTEVEHICKILSRSADSNGLLR